VEVTIPDETVRVVRLHALNALKCQAVLGERID
jgi:hypothetical protein